MPIPDFIVELRRSIGHAQLWLPGVTAVVLRGDDVLLVRRSDNGRWGPVTGIVDPGENPIRTAVREVAEETGVVCVVEALVGVSAGTPIEHTNGDRAQYLTHTFRCRYVSGEPYPADDESSDVGWFALTDTPWLSRFAHARISAAVEFDGVVSFDDD